MKVEIFSDVACPWCYIGKRRFEAALARFEHSEQVEIVWRSYQLDPQAPRFSGQTLNQILASKYGMSVPQATAANLRVSALAAEVGLEYHLEKSQYGNTFDAHRLLQLAATYHLQTELEERLFKAYFSEGAALGDSETLVKLASEVGLDADEARRVLESSAYAEEVRADGQRARALGIGGVPFFILEEKYAVSGAQPTEVFSAALAQVWAEAYPLASLTEKEAGLCEDDNCAIAREEQGLV